MNLYLFRHGESTGNQQHLFSGWGQMPLTDKGKIQALALKEKVDGLSFDCAFSSDLPRALQTGHIVLPDAELIQDPDLREVSVGILTGKKVEDCGQEYGEDLLYCRKARDFTRFGGENGEDIRRRASRFLERVSLLNAEQIAVFTHEGFIKAMLSAVVSPSWIDDRRLSHGNCAYSVFTYSREQGWKLLKWNNE